MKESPLTAPPHLRAARKVREGVVVSDKMNKTRVIKVSWHSSHPRYQKVLRRFTQLYAHDETNDSHAGDRVEVMETRPLSKLKRWRITRVLAKAAL
ncbi:MAG: 30S ribosomal protein S17 [Elusimicrobia bacterium RIFCSPLOWO2_01_FULL_59_12]|nr:MAG: 30S ribosomal protein S17 [Elusimicrobia bacterium RIFCSPLOWO2_01_FULL_59_12]